MRKFVIAVAVLLFLAISLGSLQAAPAALTTAPAAALNANPQRARPVRLCGVAPRDYFVRVSMKGPSDSGFVLRGAPSMNQDFSWCFDTTLEEEGTWQVRISAVSPTGEWLGYLDQFTLTTSATTSVATVQLQQGVDSYTGTTDCYISDWEEGDTTKAFGALEPSTLRLRKVDRKSVLVRFELEGVPPNAQIQHAFLGIYAFFNSNPSGPTYFAYQMLRPWSEDEATWKSPRVGENWAEQGATGEGTDRKAAYLDKICRPVDDPVNDTCGVIIPGWHQFDITEAVQAWVDGEPNYGVLLRSWDPFWNSRAENSFYSSEWQQIAMRPRLIIYYTQEDATPTPEPTPTRTRTPMPPGPGKINGSVRYEGHGAAPSASWEMPLVVTAHLPGDPIPAYTFNVTSNQHGAFVVPSGILTGTYDVGVRNSHSLRNRKANVAINANTAPLDMGLLREGDTNQDNWVNALDFSILNNTYWRQKGQTGFDARADFNDDNWINALDFSLLNANYWKQGDTTSSASLAPTWQSDAATTEQDDPAPLQSSGNVTVRVEPSSKTVSDQQIFTVDVYLDAGANPVDMLDCVMSYDTTYLEGRAIRPGSTLPLPLGSTHITNGVIEYHRGVDLGSSPKTGSFKLFTLEFRAKAPISSTSLPFGDVFVAGAGVGHNVTKRNGTITIQVAAATPVPTQTPTPSPTSSPQGKIEGVAFLDVVENDTLDPGESGVSGVTVQLLNQSNDLLETRQTSTTGYYAFGNLPDGTYTIRTGSLPAGYGLVNSSPRVVSLSTGNTETVNLGLKLVTNYKLNLPFILRGPRP